MTDDGGAIMRLRQWKKVLALVLVALLLVMAAGCKKEAQEDEGQDQVAEGYSEDSRTVPVMVLTHEERVELLQEAQEVNELAYAWLCVPGTNISYPVIFDPANDNAYWENRTLEGEVVQQVGGDWVDTVIFAGYETVWNQKTANYRTVAGESVKLPDSKNIVLFGHNWTNISKPYLIGDDGTDVFTMFAQLVSFDDFIFSQEFQYIYLSTLEEEYIWQVFSVMYTEANWYGTLGLDYFQANPATEEFKTMLSEMRQRSIYNFDIEVSEKDRILTLSTCTNTYPSAGNRQRFVVVGKLLEGGETDDSLAEVTRNEDVKNPLY